MNTYRLKLITLRTKDASSLSVLAYANLHRPRSPHSTIGPKLSHGVTLHTEGIFRGVTLHMGTPVSTHGHATHATQGALPHSTHGVERDSPVN